MARRKNNALKVIIFIIIFAIFFVAVFFGVQFFTKTGIFRIPGVVYYSDNLTSNEVALLDTIFTDELDLDKDVKIDAEYVLDLPSLKDGEYLYDIYVPVTDFYSTETNININSVNELFD